MKKVFTNPSVVPCDLLKGLLEASGIPAMIKNERGSASAGEAWPIPQSISAAFAWPEVWVPDDRQEKQSLSIRYGYAHPTKAGPLPRPPAPQPTFSGFDVARGFGQGLHPL